MDAAQAALVGVALSTVGGWIGAALQRKWTRADRSELTAAERQRAADARVFEHKMPAYLALMNASSQFSTGLFEWDTRAVRMPLPTMRELIPVLDALDRVKAFGAADVATAGEALVLEFELLLTGELTPEHLNTRLQSAIRAEHALTNAIRADLGAGEPLVFSESRFDGWPPVEH